MAGCATLALTTVLSTLSVTPAVAATVAAPPATTVVNLPPQPAAAQATLLVFPSRDFVTTGPGPAGSGYPAGGNYTVNIIRNGIAIGSATTTDPDAGVNHPGGACWDVQTPDIRPGDIVRVTDQKGVANQTVVQNLQTQAPTQDAQGNLVIHGFAASAGGNPVPVGAPLPVASLESRVLAPKGSLFSNGKRDIRAGAGNVGTLTYDPIDLLTNPSGTNWTAVYKIRANGGSLTPADVALAIDPGAQPRLHWLGTDPAALTETTIWELPNAGAAIGPGPQAPCTSALQTGPTVNFAPAPGAYRAAQSVVITSSDPAALITFTTDGTTPPSTGGRAGPITVPIKATSTLKAMANNPTTAALSQLAGGAYVVDAIAPVAAIGLSGTSATAGVYRGAVTASISATDAGSSGLASLRYTLDGGPATDIASGGTLLIPGDGKHTVTATATDLAGNVNTPVNQTFLIDTVAPTATVALSGTVGNPGFYRSAVTATVTAADNIGGSGVSKFIYVLDGGTPSISTTATFTVSAAGNHQLVASVEDAAGNTSTPATTSFVIDMTPPTLVASPAGGTFTGAQSITLLAPDALASTIYYTLDGTTPSEASAIYSTSIPVGQSLTLSSIARDAAGNMSAVRSDIYTIATVAVPAKPAPAPAGGGGGGGGGGGAKPSAPVGGGGDAAIFGPAANVPFLAPAVGEQPMVVPAASLPALPTEARPAVETAAGVPDVSLVATPLAVTPPETVPAEPLTMIVDPAVGGTLSTSDGALSVVVPAGWLTDSLTLSVSHVLGVAQNHGNLALGSQMFLVTISTSAGDILSTFDPPVAVTIRPSADDVTSANGDLTTLVMMALDPDSGAFQPLATTITDDGSITASVGRLGMPVAPPSMSPELPASPEGEQSQPVVDGSSLPSEEAAADLESEALP